VDVWLSAGVGGGLPGIGEDLTALDLLPGRNPDPGEVPVHVRSDGAPVDTGLDRDARLLGDEVPDDERAAAAFRCGSGSADMTHHAVVDGDHMPARTHGEIDAIVTDHTTAQVVHRTMPLEDAKRTPMAT
jgi:hypothetical protein